jgi:hypothetical protein
MQKINPIPVPVCMMNTGHRSGCLICGDELIYLDQPETCTCAICGKVRETTARCRAGHFICDQCHALPADDLIEEFCSNTDGTDPMSMAIVLMNNPAISMHGPEHHFLVPAVLLAAYYNRKGLPEMKPSKIKIARTRAEQIKGGFCGFMGDCGAAVGTGIFISIITGATPLSKEEWQLTNLCTAETLHEIALHGGPRCCKRNLFLAIRAAVRFLLEHFDQRLPLPPEVRCEFSPLNRECRMNECPFYPDNP